MSGDFKGLKFVAKLDKLQEEYAKKQKEFAEIGDLYAKEKNYPRNEAFDCRFRESCYALKSKMGTCPCGLNEPI
jgi:hypothetical protein